MKLTLMLLVLIVSSCNYKIEKNDVRDVQISDEMLNSVSYKQLREEVLIPKCLSCHGNAGGVNLESYESCVKHISDISRSCLQTKSMPKAPVSPLNQRQLEVLTAWVEAGGPEKPSTPDSSENQDEEPSSGFKKIKSEILETKCLSCHSKGEHAGHIPLETKEDLLHSPLSLVIPGKPEASLIHNITAPGAMNMMPPIGVEPLSKAQRELIRIWIQEGAL